MRTSVRRVIATALVAGGLATSLVACAGGGPGDASPSATIPERIEVSGRSIPLDGLQPWTLASIPARTSTSLTVFATGSDDGGGPCGPPVVRMHAEETATEVLVSAAAYQDQGGPDLACPAIGYVPSPQPLELARPLGDRRLVAIGAGEAPELVVGTEVPDVADPPAPFTDGVLGRDDGTIATRSWTAGDDGPTMRLVVETPEAARDRGLTGRVVARPDIGGATGTVVRSGDGRYAQLAVRWTPTDDRTLTVQLSNGATKRWSDDEAIEVARSVTGGG